MESCLLLLLINIELSQRHLLKIQTSFPGLLSILWLKIISFCVFTSAVFILSPCSFPVCLYHYQIVFSITGLQYVFISRIVISSASFLFFKIALNICGRLCFQINICITFSVYEIILGF